MTSLRSRLLLSYMVVIGLTLCAVSTALLLLLVNNSLPSRLVYQRLDDITRASVPYLLVQTDSVDRQLAFVAENNKIRTLRIDTDDTVLFDSAGTFEVGESISPRPVSPPGRLVYRGAFRDPGGPIWLYVALDSTGTERDLGLFFFALPRPRGRIFSLFENNLLSPLFQAGLIGIIISIVLAVVISRSVSRPLHHVSEAAKAIASGDYQHRAPEEGPSEVHDLARAFNEMAGQVQRTQQTQRDFLANVSHELKTPLTSIQGYSQAILDGAASDPTAAAKVIYDEAGRMRRLVEELLDLARIESGQTPMRRATVDLSGLLAAVLNSLALHASEKDITLMQEPSNLPSVVGDADRLAQVFTNLLDNALTHTPWGGQVTVQALQVGEGIEVSVSDTGPGIPSEDLDRIFERFHQTDKSRARTGAQGTGLGLAISREIIEAHGGRISAKNGPERGAIFTVWLPLPRPADTTVTRRPVR